MLNLLLQFGIFEILKRLQDNIEFIFGKSCGLTFLNSLVKIGIGTVVQGFKGIILVVFSEVFFDS